MILKKNSGIRIELTSQGILHSCMVTLKLGEYRDVVLGLNDEKYYGRRGSDFYEDTSCVPTYIAADNMLAVVYPKGGTISGNIFFNLKGCGVGNIEDHNLTVNSGFFWYEGELVDVTDTPLDFKRETPIGERIRVGYKPLVERKGYDHIFKINWLEDDVADAASVITEEDGETVIHEEMLNPAATLLDRERTLEMSVYTNLDYIHLYTGNHMSGKDIGKGGCIYPNRGGVAIMPYTPNESILSYDGICVYKFTPKEII